jgi:hypothetical protein
MEEKITEGIRGIFTEVGRPVGKVFADQFHRVATAGTAMVADAARPTSRAKAQRAAFELDHSSLFLLAGLLATYSHMISNMISIIHCSPLFESLLVLSALRLSKLSLPSVVFQSVGGLKIGLKCSERNVLEEV